MVIVQLKGGMGNQLFQYAAAFSLAQHHNTTVKADVTLLLKPDEAIGTMRHYELQHLLQPPAIATYQEIKAAVSQPVFKKYFQKLLPSYQRDIFNEKKFIFDQNFFSASQNVYLKGYRQSEKYFLPVESEIRRAFHFKPGLLKNVLHFSSQLSEVNSISVHIRRGDYTNAAVIKYHGTLPKEYYQTAMNIIITKVKNPLFYIFTDDVAWVKSNLRLPAEATFISGDVSNSHYQDFFLMSQCRHNIIANSSFSWWSAWLNNNPGKIIIAPQKWFGNNNRNDISDLILGNWMKI